MKCTHERSEGALRASTSHRGTDEAVPRAQPRDHRRDQPRRHRADDPGRLPGPGPAADRRWGHLHRGVHRGRRPQARRPGPDRRRPGRQGREDRARRRPRQGHLPGQDRLRVRLRDRRRDPGQHAARRHVPRPRAGRVGPARPGQGDPGRADQLAVRRRRGLLRPRRDRRGDRHRPARRVADHTGRPDPQHARGVQGGAVGRLPPVGEHRGEERADQPAAGQPAARIDGPQRARRGHRRPDEAVRHPLPGVGGASRGGAQPAGRRPRRCRPSSPPWSGRAAPTSSRR